MATIHVPRPSKKAFKPDRPVSSLLLTQIQHLKAAERNLPPRYHSDKYINAIKTEREAAAYIRHVTEAIHRAHDEAAGERAKHPRPRKRRSAVGVAKRPSGRLSSKARTKRSDSRRSKK
jgi:hypothetical protein